MMVKGNHDIILRHSPIHKKEVKLTYTRINTEGYINFKGDLRERKFPKVEGKFKAICSAHQVTLSLSVPFKSYYPVKKRNIQGSEPHKFYISNIFPLFRVQ